MASRSLGMVPGIILVVGLLLTVSVWSALDGDADARFDEAFEAEVARLESNVLERFAANTQVLLGGVGLWNVEQDVAREDWATYVASLDLEQTYPGIQGVGYSLFIEPEHLDAHHQSIRNQTAPPGPLIRPDLFSNYTVHDVSGAAHQAELYTSIIYLEPFDLRNQNAMGLDMYSHPERRKAMDRAIDTGQPALSGRVTLVQEIDEDVQPGFLLYIPHYAQGMPLNTPEERREAVLGFVYSPLRAGDLMRGIIGDDNPDVTFTIHDVQFGEEHLLFDGGQAQGARTMQNYLVIAGREWVMTYHNGPDFVPSRQNANVAAAGGIVLTASLVALATAQTRVQRRAEAIATEMTAELRHSESKLTQLTQDLERSNEDLEQFAYIASHDLQEPVRTIASFLELLEMEDGDRISDDGKTYVEAARRSAIRIQRLIVDLLDYSRAGREPATRPCDATAVMDDVLIDMQGAIKDAGATVTVEPVPPLAVRSGDYQRIMTNLLNNALKYTDGTPPIIGIDCAVQGAWVKIGMHDSGPGIPDESKSTVFGMFKRLHRADTHPGTGMGLAICQRIVEAYGGQIWIEDGKAGGSSFYLRLPTA